jgi:hypothetical protein
MRCLSHVLLGMQTQNPRANLTYSKAYFGRILTWAFVRREEVRTPPSGPICMTSCLVLVTTAKYWGNSFVRIRTTWHKCWDNNHYYKYSQKYLWVSVLNVNVFFNLLGSFLRMYMMVRTVMEWTAGRERILVRCRRRTWSWSWPEKKRTFIQTCLFKNIRAFSQILTCPKSINSKQGLFLFFVF